MHLLLSIYFTVIIVPVSTRNLCLRTLFKGELSMFSVCFLIIFERCLKYLPLPFPPLNIYWTYFWYLLFIWLLTEIIYQILLEICSGICYLKVSFQFFSFILLINFGLYLNSPSLHVLNSIFIELISGISTSSYC